MPEVSDVKEKKKKGAKEDWIILCFWHIQYHSLLFSVTVINWHHSVDVSVKRDDERQKESKSVILLLLDDQNSILLSKEANNI
jgi:hypothetical protein